MASVSSLIKIDVTNPALIPVKDYYEVKQTPWLIALDKDRIAFKEVPND